MNLNNQIGWCTATWNPLVMRCNPISEGCERCWHLRMVKRLEANPLIHVSERVAYKEWRIILRKKELDAPMRRKEPEIIAVQLMGDLFHENVNTHFIDAILEVIDVCPQHTFLMLTKRPENMERKLYEVTEAHGCRELGGNDYIKNLWLGVTVENQARADERIPILLSIPAARHFVSVEPMLGPVNLPDRIDWVIVGPETGPKARECKGWWIQHLRGDCKTAGVPFWDKRKDFIARERPENS